MIGSNTVNRVRNLSRAVSYIGSLLKAPRVSGLYETPDFSGIGADYLNIVIAGIWDGDIGSLNKLLHEKETELGRDCNDKANVALDIDIVVADGKILKEKEFNSIAFSLAIKDIGKNRVQ